MIPDFRQNATVYIKTDNGYEELGEIRALEYQASYEEIPTLNMEVVVTYKEHKKESEEMEEFEVEKTHVIDPNHLDRGVGLVVKADSDNKLISVYFENWTQGHNGHRNDNIKDKYKQGYHLYHYDKSNVVIIKEDSLISPTIDLKDLYATIDEVVDVEKEEMEMKELNDLVNLYENRALIKIDEYFDTIINDLIENNKRVVEYKNIVSSFNDTLNEFINGLDEEEKKMFDDFEDMITYPFEIDYEKVEEYLDTEKIKDAKRQELLGLGELLDEVKAHLRLIGKSNEGMFAIEDVYNVLQTYNILDENNRLQEYTIKNFIDDKKSK